jgi:hypothetical protein
VVQLSTAKQSIANNTAGGASASTSAKKASASYAAGRASASTTASEASANNAAGAACYFSYMFRFKVVRVASYMLFNAHLCMHIILLRTGGGT